MTVDEMYDTLDEVPWSSVDAVRGPSGYAVGLDRDFFAVWVTGPRTGQRIALDAHGPWMRVAVTDCAKCKHPDYFHHEADSCDYDTKHGRCTCTGSPTKCAVGVQEQQ